MSHGTGKRRALRFHTGLHAQRPLMGVREATLKSGGGHGSMRR